jgi:electron transfer flavoprotein beta subunit
VVSAQKGLNEPRYASLKGIMGAKKKTIQALDAAGVSLDSAALAPKLKLTALELPPARPAVKLIQGDPATQAKEMLRLLHEEAKVI